MDIRTFLTEIIPIKDKNLKQILEKECKVDIFRQGSSINEVGKIDYYVRFLISGAVRGFIVDKKDNNDDFYDSFRGYHSWIQNVGWKSIRNRVQGFER